jgi:hypothetical protein
MNQELLILKILLNAESYKKYSSDIDTQYLKDNFKELSYIYNTLQKMREDFPDTNLSVDELTAYFWTLYPEAKKDLYSSLLNSIAEAAIDPAVGDGILSQIKKRRNALKLAELSFAYTQGRATLEQLTECFGELQTVKDDRPSEYDGDDTDLDKLLHAAFTDGGIRWRLDFLNKSLGPLRAGDFGFLFKRPESGGTAFCASEVGYMLDQVEQPIVWINNEESNDKVMLRVYQAYFGVSVDVLLGNSGYYKDLWNERVGKKLRFFGLERSSRRDIEGIVRHIKPSIVIYDQLDKVAGFDADREDLKLGAIYQWARELSKQGHAAIGVTQADGIAEGIKWLSMANVSSAKTSKQAEADFILGMGRIADPNMENIRYLTICKNKLLGDKETIPTLRHGRCEVLIQPEIMQFKDIIKYD